MSDDRCKSCGTRTSYPDLCERCLEVQERRARAKAQDQAAGQRVIFLPLSPLYLLWIARRPLSWVLAALFALLFVHLSRETGHLSHDNLHFDTRPMWALVFAIVLAANVLVQRHAKVLLRLPQRDPIDGLRVWRFVTWSLLVLLVWSGAALWGSFEMPLR
jgi:hypothetical protein